MFRKRGSNRINIIPMAEEMAYAELPYQEARIRSEKMGMWGEAKDFAKMAGEAAENASNEYLMAILGQIAAEDDAIVRRAIENWAPPEEPQV
jgi:hypothetical protein